LGKQIILSIGGAAAAGSYYLTSTDEAQQAANDIFAAFGPSDPTWTLGRPFGDAVVDGFDLDLEQGADQGENGQIYADFASALREKFSSAGKSMILTAAPQCIYPDAQLNIALTTVSFDYIFVQFYDNPSCRPSNYVSSDATTAAAQLTTFQNWNAIAAGNPSGTCQWFLGLLASPGSADYTTQADLNKILGAVQPMSNFGGAMLWEMTSAANDTNANGVNYIDQVKHNLQGNPDLPTTTSSSATTSASATPFAVTATAPPGETHLSITPNCNQWHLVASGELNPYSSCLFRCRSNA
jgi:chitinase